uniref:maturase-related protein n=1 Tax=Zostera japonica TaxID=187286 RepID=UPI00226CC387|nr:maturase-related protein [Zostera japonica]YP_010574211.1 maturase-related protein [Zostera japonica]UZH94048.1 maturase-related protein [Zostera japonica]UZH94063.1 maturase-related protein [Zostera japonica]
MVLESIYDPEFPDTSHFRSGRGCHSALRRIKEEWGTSKKTPARALAQRPFALARSGVAGFGRTSRWFLEFEVRKCFHTIDRHRFISIFKEEIDDPKFFYPINKLFSARRLVGGEKGPYSVPHSVLLSALSGNIYLNKLDQEIGRIRQKHEIPMVQRIRKVLLRTGRRIDDQSNSREEASFNAPQDNRAVVIVGRDEFPQKSKATFPCFVLAHPLRRGDQKRPFVFPPVNPPAAFLNKPSSLLCAAFLQYITPHTTGPRYCIPVFRRFRCGKSRERFLENNLAKQENGCTRNGFRASALWSCLCLRKYCKRRGLLIELGGEARLIRRGRRSERGLARNPSKTHYWRRICYARYADDSLLGIVGAVELLIEIQKRITRSHQVRQSGPNLWGLPAGSTTIAARSTVEFPGTVIREVPPRTTPIPFLRELEKRLRVKHRVHITACHLRSAIHGKWGYLGEGIPIKELTKGMTSLSSLYRTGSPLDAVRLSETLGTAGVPKFSSHSTSVSPTFRYPSPNVSPTFRYPSPNVSPTFRYPSPNVSPTFRYPSPNVLTDLKVYHNYRNYHNYHNSYDYRHHNSFGYHLTYRPVSFDYRLTYFVAYLTVAFSYRLTVGYPRNDYRLTVGYPRNDYRLTVGYPRNDYRLFDYRLLYHNSYFVALQSSLTYLSVSWGMNTHILSSRSSPREIEFLQGNVPQVGAEDQAVSRSVRKFSSTETGESEYTPAGLFMSGRAAGAGTGFSNYRHWAGSFSSEFPIQIEAPVKKILRRLRDRGIISRRRPWPIHVACLTNVSDGDIVNWSAGIAISPLSYYRCCDNLYQVRTIVDHQIRWSALFTLAHKHKSSARNIIPKYSKDSNIVNQEGGKILAEFPNSIELGKLGPGRRSEPISGI